MPNLILKDSEGKDVELPVEKLEDLVAMKAENEKLKKEFEDTANKDWRAARDKIDANERLILKAKEDAKKAGYELQADGTFKKIEGAPAMDEKSVEEKVKVQLAAAKEFDVEETRKDLVIKLAAGDANKANVLEEKYKLLKGEKKIVTLKEMQSLMEDARKLAFGTKENDGNGFNNLGGGGEMGGGADRTKTASKERGKEIARELGYRPKTKGGFDKL